MRQGLGCGMGRTRRQLEPWITPTLPQAANIVRAWSMRRCVPAYLGGNSIRADRPSAPVGSPGILGALTKSGVIDFPAGADANAYELYDQKGEANAALVVAGGNLANAPLVYSSGAILKGLRLQDTSDLMAMAATDAALSAAFNDNLTGYSISLWMKINSSSASQSIIFTRKTQEAGNIRISHALANNTIYAAMRGNATTELIIIGNAVAGWNHVVVTLKGADGTANGRKAYLNVSTVVQSAVPAIPNGITAVTTRIGPLNAGGNTDVNDIIVWNRELSADDVLALFNAQAPYYGVSAK